MFFIPAGNVSALFGHGRIHNFMRIVAGVIFRLFFRMDLYRVPGLLRSDFAVLISILTEICIRTICNDDGLSIRHGCERIVKSALFRRKRI